MHCGCNTHLPLRQPLSCSRLFCWNFMDTNLQTSLAQCPRFWRVIYPDRLQGTTGSVRSRAGHEKTLAGKSLSVHTATSKRLSASEKGRSSLGSGQEDGPPMHVGLRCLLHDAVLDELLVHDVDEYRQGQAQRPPSRCPPHALPGTLAFLLFQFFCSELCFHCRGCPCEFSKNFRLRHISLSILLRLTGRPEDTRSEEKHDPTASATGVPGCSCCKRTNHCKLR